MTRGAALKQQIGQTVLMRAMSAQVRMRNERDQARDVIRDYEGTVRRAMDALDDIKSDFAPHKIDYVITLLKAVMERSEDKS